MLTHFYLAGMRAGNVKEWRARVSKSRNFRGSYEFDEFDPYSDRRNLLLDLIIANIAYQLPRNSL